LNQTMEVYAVYANFSFYTEQDMLRMIDYNVYPSFILTHDPAFELISTNSSNFYSTEFALYEELIHDMYDMMNEAYEDVLNARWVDREIVQPGVIVNTYDNGVQIVINYTDEMVYVDTHAVTAQSYRVLN
ncbi:MAG TPA: DUF5696 domain-containing protein, partial [Acholeplasmataceae bacterium]|nr:DUF5696 domain-containing protein [Acholeplasmataceae bacterium]